MKGYWIALYKKIDNQENLKMYAEKVTEYSYKLWRKTSG